MPSKSLRRTLPAREHVGAHTLCYDDAAARGTSEGLHLALNVGAMLISFIALVALANALPPVAGRAPAGVTRNMAAKFLEADIAKLVEHFVASGKRAERAGFDFVEKNGWNTLAKYRLRHHAC